MKVSEVLHAAADVIERDGWAAERDCARWNARVGQADAWRVVRVGVR